MIVLSRFLSLLGFVVSGYALYVRLRILKPGNYKPACEIHERISCTKAFTSKYGQTLGIPNPSMGLLYYSVFFITSFYYPQLLIYLASVAFIFCLYLAFVSYIVQKNFCVVCSSIYIINTALLILELLN